MTEGSERVGILLLGGRGGNRFELLVALDSFTLKDDILTVFICLYCYAEEFKHISISLSSSVNTLR